MHLFYRKAVTPFSVKARENGLIKLGGKMDDITVTVAQVDINSKIISSYGSSSLNNTFTNAEADTNEFSYSNYK